MLEQIPFRVLVRWMVLCTAAIVATVILAFEMPGYTLAPAVFLAFLVCRPQPVKLTDAELYEWLSRG